MALLLYELNIKARDPEGLARFWAAALGWDASVAPPGFRWGDTAAFRMDFVPVPDPESVRDRVHIDLATTSDTHHAELVDRLLTLGAKPADIGQGDVSWTVLADPEGNVFCVLEPRETYRDTGPIAAVVVDCADPGALAGFWGAALGWVVHDRGDDHVRLRSAAGRGAYLELFRKPGPRTWWNHIHLDLAPHPGDDHRAEAERLRGLGAADLDIGQGDVPWTVMADPEGNPFCVLAPGGAP